MDLYEGILTTRAMRRFTDEPVTDAEIETCLRAAAQGPSGGNIQPWQFLVVREPARRAALGDIYRRAYDRYERTLLATVPPFKNEAVQASWERTTRASRHLAEHLGDASALVLFLMPDIDLTLRDDEGPMDIGTTYASVYPAVQNFMLAARGLGIGTALTTVYRIYHDEVRSVCDVPDGFQVVALVPMGRPTGQFGIAPRRPWHTLTHWDRFGNRRAPSA
jgi:nitroreductase